MKLNTLLGALACLSGFAAFVYGGIVSMIGGSFAVWSPGHQPDYFFNIHAGLLEKAGIAVSALAISLFFGLVAAFRRIRELELRVGAARPKP